MWIYEIKTEELPFHFHWKKKRVSVSFTIRSVDLTRDFIMCWLTWASWNSKSQATDENAGIGFVFYTLIFQSIYAHVSLVHVTLNPVCTNVCQSRFNGGRPVRPCVARRAWSGLESRKSRQRSETMNSYSANVASEISMRARNAARVLQKFRGGNGAAWIYLHTSYIHVRL